MTTLIRLKYECKVTLMEFSKLSGVHSNFASFKNNPHMSFDNTSLNPEQELELVKDPNGTLEYPLKLVFGINLNVCFLWLAA